MRTLPPKIQNLHNLPTTSPLPAAHCARIQVDEAYLKIDPDDTSSIQELFSDASITCKSSSKYTISILHASVTLEIQRLPDGRYRVESVRVDLQRLLFGHSGRVIQSAYELHWVLSILNYLLNKLLDEYSQDRCIPGLIEGCTSYWCMLEIPLQLHDPDGKLLRALSNAKHSMIRKEALYKQGQSVCWKGSNLKVCIYRKDIQLEERYHLEVGKDDKDVLRSEITVKGPVLTRSTGLQADERLTTFGPETLYQVFLKAMKGIRGGYRILHDQPNLDKISDKAKFMAEMLMSPSCSMNTDQLLDTYQASTDCSNKTRQKLARDVRKYLQASSDFLLSELFPDDRPPSSAAVTPMRKLKDAKGQYTGELAVAGAYAETRGIKLDERIVAAYQGVKSIPYEHFSHSKDFHEPHPDMRADYQAKEYGRRRP